MDGRSIDRIHIIKVLSQISESLYSLSPQQFLGTLPQNICSLLKLSACILWKADREQQKFQVFACTDNISPQYKTKTLDFQQPGVLHLFNSNRVLSISNLKKIKYKQDRFINFEEAIKNQFTSLMSIPIVYKEQKWAIIDVLTKEKIIFQDEEKELLPIVSNYVKISFEKLEKLQKKEEIESERRKLQDLVDILHDMTAASQSNNIWKLMEQGAEKLVNARSIWLGRWNHVTGDLEPISGRETEYDNKKTEFGKSVITQLIKNEIPTVDLDLENNNNNNQFYSSSWTQNKFELAIPLIDVLLIRDKPELESKFGSKVIGIVIIESDRSNAFSEADEERLCLLARHGAIKLERLDFYKRIFGIRQVEKKITTAANHDEIILNTIEVIKEVLGFDWINISLVNSSRTQIKSMYTIGLPEEKETQFKKDAMQFIL